MPEGVVGLGRVQVRRPISASSAIAASSPIARRAPLQTWPQAKVGTWTRRNVSANSKVFSDATHGGGKVTIGVAVDQRRGLQC